jgi:hypothetical protein
MNWMAVLPALLGIIGVVVGAYLTTRLRRYETYSDWRRDHLYELYTELAPILYRIRGAPDSDLGIIGDNLRALMPRVVVLCSEEARVCINKVYEMLGRGVPPWYLTEEERLKWKPPRPLGIISGTVQRVDDALTAMERDLRSPTTSRTKAHQPFAAFKSWQESRARQDR